MSNQHRPIAEPVLNLPGAEVRRMFGAESIYVDGLLLLVLADGEQPWNGLLFPAERDHHPSILEEYPFLVNHQVLPKWLYLNAEDDRFEQRAEDLIERLLQRDPRFGVVPKPRKKRAGKTKKEESPGGKKERGSPAQPKDGRPPHLM